MLYASADWVDGAGVERARFLEGVPLTIRGISVNHETVLPRFGKLNETPAAPSGFPPPTIGAARYHVSGQLVSGGGEKWSSTWITQERIYIRTTLTRAKSTRKKQSCKRAM